MRIYHYTVVITREESGGCVVTCPALPGLVTEGDTLEDVRRMAADAILCYLEGLRKAGLPTPSDKQPVTKAVTVKLT